MTRLVVEMPDTLNEALDRLAERIRHREPLMRAISEDMYDAVMENFEQEGRPAWAPITRAGKILQDSGRLRSSIDSDSDNNEAIVGTNVVYARIHQLGGKTKPHVIRPRNKQALYFNGRFARQVNHPGSDIPARPFLTLEDDDLRQIEQRISDYLNGAFDG